MWTEFEEYETLRSRLKQLVGARHSLQCRQLESFVLTRPLQRRGRLERIPRAVTVGANGDADAAAREFKWRQAAVHAAVHREVRTGRPVTSPTVTETSTRPSVGDGGMLESTDGDAMTTIGGDTVATSSGGGDGTRLEGGTGGGDGLAHSGGDGLATSGGEGMNASVEFGDSPATSGGEGMNASVEFGDSPATSGGEAMATAGGGEDGTSVGGDGMTSTAGAATAVRSTAHVAARPCTRCEAGAVARHRAMRSTSAPAEAKKRKLKARLRQYAEQFRAREGQTPRSRADWGEMWTEFEEYETLSKVVRTQKTAAATVGEAQLRLQAVAE